MEGMEGSSRIRHKDAELARGWNEEDLTPGSSQARTPRWTVVTEQPRWVAIPRRLQPCPMCAATGRWNVQDLTPDLLLSTQAEIMRFSIFGTLPAVRALALRPP